MQGVKDSSPICIVDGCNFLSRAKGYCSKHYAKMWKTGTLERIAGTPEGNRRLREGAKSRISELRKIDPTPDIRKGQHGTLALKKYHQIRNDAKKAGYDWDLSPLEVYYLFTAPCHYCGVESNWPLGRNGIDRVNTTVGYFKNNVVTACQTCNMAKGTKTFEELLVWCKRFATKNGIM